MEGRTFALAGACLVAAVLAFAFHAAAAPFDPTLAVNATFPAAALTPFVEAPGFPALEDVKVRFPMRVDLTVPAGAVTEGPTRVVFEATEEPFWLVVTFDPPFIALGAGGPHPHTEPTTYSEVVDVVIHANKAAPSGTQGAVELTARALRLKQENQPVATATVEGLVVARPYVLFKAKASDVMLDLDRFGNATILVAVTNSGNALVAPVVQVAHADAGLEAKAVPVPVVLRPNPLEFLLEEAFIPVEVRHRSGAGGEVLLLVTSAMPDEGALVQEQTVRLHVDVADTGGPSATLPLVGLGVVAGVVFLLRRT